MKFLHSFLFGTILELANLDPDPLTPLNPDPDPTLVCINQSSQLQRVKKCYLLKTPMFCIKVKLYLHYKGMEEACDRFANSF
jgi:hypothetical protein